MSIGQWINCSYDSFNLIDLVMENKYKRKKVKCLLTGRYCEPQYGECDICIIEKEKQAKLDDN